jgi:hypothetical protein
MSDRSDALLEEVRSLVEEMVDGGPRELDLRQRLAMKLLPAIIESDTTWGGKRSIRADVDAAFNYADRVIAKGKK